MPTHKRVVAGRGAGWRLVVGIAAWYTLAACAAHEGQQQGAPKPLEDPIPERIERGELEIGLKKVADGMTAPNWGTFAPGREEFLFVADQAGIVWSVDLGDGRKSVFLDVRKRLVRLDPKYDERGLLGLAFHPDFSNNGRLYTYTSEPASGRVDFSTMPRGSRPDHHTVVAQWRVPDPASSTSLVDPNSAAELLRIEQPQANHNAGGLVFGPDRMLYIALGDGGGADDQGTGHAADGNGQEPGNILGAILRIDPSGTSGVNGRYGVPEDNPFVKDPRAVAEIYAYGFRCPFRMSFDPKTSRLLAGDVGQNDVEEIDLVEAGGNYGWRLREGSFEFHHNGAEQGYVTPPQGDQPGLIDPIAQYDQDEGNSVIGGFVYCGKAIPELRDAYIFGDWQGDSKQGRLFYLKPPIADDRLNAIHEFRIAGQELSKLMLHGFGEDADGEIYVLANGTGAPSGRTGLVRKVVPPPAPQND
jgi:glucose/arabinose dehydrogenase